LKLLFLLAFKYKEILQQHTHPHSAHSQQAPLAFDEAPTDARLKL
jgi:hypothetical protein